MIIPLVSFFWNILLQLFLFFKQNRFYPVYIITITIHPISFLNRSGKKIDIQHPVITSEPPSIIQREVNPSPHSPTQRMDSTSSCGAESVKSAGRDRVDSYDKHSRTDSVSSVGNLSADSMGSAGYCCKRHTTPVIDMKPIEFWTANRYTIVTRPCSLYRKSVCVCLCVCVYVCLSVCLPVCVCFQRFLSDNKSLLLINPCSWNFVGR